MAEDGLRVPHTSRLLHTGAHWCTQAKLHKANRGDTDTTEATDCWQDIQIDFGFFVQRSSGRQDKKKPKSKPRKETRKSRLVRSLHDLQVLTRAQRRKLSTPAGTDTPTDPKSDHAPKRTPSPAPTVETSRKMILR